MTTPCMCTQFLYFDKLAEELWNLKGLRLNVHFIHLRDTVLDSDRHEIYYKFEMTRLASRIRKCC